MLACNTRSACTNGDPVYTYDKLDRVTSMTSPVGTTEYEYDSISGRLTKITSPQGKEFIFTYDRGQLESMSRPNGITTWYEFDQNGNLTLLDHRVNGNTLRKYDNTYDANGMRTSMADVDGLHEYTYDSLYQIIRATHPYVQRPLEEFHYDEVGNWLGGGRVHNELNQLTEDDSCFYEYDSDGNMTLNISKGSGDSTKYHWNIENRLIKVEMPNGTVAEYVYGSLGRRLAKVVNGIRKEYRYDGEDLILEMDENDSITTSYTYGHGVDDPLIMTRGNTTYYYIKDEIGSVTALTDSVANVVQEYQYSVFGELVDQAGIDVLNPFRYTAREWDEEASLYYYRNRYYDPSIGRFLSEDPIQFMAGDVNLYRYVNNSPLNFHDPLGLWCIPLPKSRKFIRKEKAGTEKEERIFTIGAVYGTESGDLITMRTVITYQVYRARYRITEREFCCEKVCPEVGCDDKCEFKCRVKKGKSYVEEKYERGEVLDQKGPMPWVKP